MIQKDTNGLALMTIYLIGFSIIIMKKLGSKGVRPMGVCPKGVGSKGGPKPKEVWSKGGLVQKESRPKGGLIKRES